MNITNLISPKNISIREALVNINAGKQGILLITNTDGTLYRTLTDGDIRRQLLTNADLDLSISYIPFNKPFFSYIHTDKSVVLEIMRSNRLSHIPVLDQYNIPIDLIHINDIQLPILLSTPHIGDKEIEFVSEAFDSNWVAPVGPNIDAFELELAERVGISYSAATSSGTSAIHLALLLLNVGKGDSVYCSSLTFAASAFPILYQNAKPIFIDSERNTWNMSPESLQLVLERDNKQNSLPKAVIIANIYGQSAEMDQLLTLCDQFNVPVIEDAAESLGSLYKGRHSGTFGTLGIYSFNGNKIITTSGGGMIVSDDKKLIEKAKFLSTQARDNSPYYLHSHIGYNYRMSNVLAGIGRGQLRVLDDRINSRRDIFSYYKSSLSSFSELEWMPEPDGFRSNRWLSCVLLPIDSPITVSDVISQLAKVSIECRHIWNPMHRQPIFRSCEFVTDSQSLSVADDLFARGFCLPSGSNLKRDQQDHVISTLTSLLSKYFK